MFAHDENRDVFPIRRRWIFCGGYELNGNEMAGSPSDCVEILAYLTDLTQPPLTIRLYEES